jgi:hypothetical protein
VHRVAENRLGKREKCVECGNLFVLSPGDAIAESVTGPAQREAIKPSRLSVLSVTMLGDPKAAPEGAIPGAIAGILAGVFAPIISGIVRGASPGDIIGTALIGFVVGFLAGSLFGGLLAVWGRRSYPDYRIESGVVLWLCGSWIGSITTIVAVNWRWIPLGAGISVVGAVFGTRLIPRSEVEYEQTNHEASEAEISEGNAERARRLRSMHQGARFSE